MNPQDQIISVFESLPSWDDRYEQIIKIGRELPMQPDSFKKEDLKVSGCQSRVWLDAKLDEQGKVIFTAESDAMLVRGLIALLLKVYSDLTPSEILATEPYFIEKLQFSQYLSPTRANGIYAVLKKIKSYALGFQYLENKNIDLV
jgi:cysteine desulfuration protein SufE